eukprot:g16403.t1
MLTEADLWLAQHLRPEVPRLCFGAGALICSSCVRTIIFDSASERLRSSMAVQVFAAKLLEEPNEEEGFVNNTNM